MGERRRPGAPPQSCRGSRPPPTPVCAGAICMPCRQSRWGSAPSLRAGAPKCGPP